MILLLQEIRRVLNIAKYAAKAWAMTWAQVKAKLKTIKKLLQYMGKTLQKQVTFNLLDNSTKDKAKLYVLPLEPTQVTNLEPAIGSKPFCLALHELHNLL